jgi:sphingomyelin phosphodiesterase acid-like 3
LKGLYVSAAKLSLAESSALKGHDFSRAAKLPKERVGLQPLREVFLLLALCLLFLIAHAPQAVSQTPPKTIQALFLSDIHFEPYWDPGKVAKLAAADPSDWKAILASPDTPNRKQDFDALEAECPSRGPDTSYGLFASALDEMKKHVGAAHFITVSGDLMAHKFDCKFQKLLPKASPADYTSFTEKTIAFIIGQLKDVAGSVPVYAALGNNDSDCGDYALNPNSPFLKSVGETIAKNVPASERKAALASLAESGSYSVSLPAMPKARLIVLDDLFFSKRYTSCPGYSGASGKTLQLAWLAKQLAAARTANEKVWVMAHLPSGVDAFSTLKRGACKGAPSMILATDGPAKPDDLTDALVDAADVIQLGIFAHTHEDEIKLLEKQPASGSAQPKQAAIPVKLVPSISPINGNLPSITVADIDPATATLIDYKVIAGSDTLPWTKQYDYADDYGEASFSADAVRDLLTKFAADSSGKDKASQNYIHNFVTGKQTSLLSLAWPAYVCTMTEETSTGFSNCACSSSQ